MATLKKVFHRKNSSGTYDTYYFSTSSDIVIRPNGHSVETDLAALETKKYYDSNIILTNNTASALNVPQGSNVSTALTTMKNNMAEYKVGDIITTTRSDLGSDWLLCDGRIVNKTLYPNFYNYYLQDILKRGKFCYNKEMDIETLTSGSDYVAYNHNICYYYDSTYNNIFVAFSYLYGYNNKTGNYSCGPTKSYLYYRNINNTTWNKITFTEYVSISNIEYYNNYYYCIGADFVTSYYHMLYRISASTFSVTSISLPVTGIQYFSPILYDGTRYVIITYAKLVDHNYNINGYIIQSILTSNNGSDWTANTTNIPKYDINQTQNDRLLSLFPMAYINNKYIMIGYYAKRDDVNGGYIRTAVACESSDSTFTNWTCHTLSDDYLTNLNSYNIDTRVLFINNHYILVFSDRYLYFSDFSTAGTYINISSFNFDNTIYSISSSQTDKLNKIDKIMYINNKYIIFGQITTTGYFGYYIISDIFTTSPVVEYYYNNNNEHGYMNGTNYIFGNSNELVSIIDATYRTNVSSTYYHHYSFSSSIISPMTPNLKELTDRDTKYIKVN